MTDNLPPLPELPPPEVEEWSETFITLRGEGWKKETVEKYATDYARAAIERQSVPQPLTDEQIDSASPVNAEHAHSFKRGARFAEAAHSITKGTASPQAQPLSDADVQQISRALHQHGLTLVRTVQGFGVMKLGEITAYAATKGTT